MGADMTSSNPIVKTPSVPSRSFSRLKGTKVGNAGYRKVRLLRRDLSHSLPISMDCSRPRRPGLGVAHHESRILVPCCMVP